MRGPLVYCLEDVDNSDADIDHVGLLDVEVTEDAPMQIGPVDGIVPIVATAKKLATNPEKSVRLSAMEIWSRDEKSQSNTILPKS